MSLGTSKTRNLLLVLGATASALLLLDAWFAAAHYQAYRVGLLEPAIIDGNLIRMKPGWYQLANSRNGIGRLFLSAEREVVWLAKAEWPRYGRVNSLVISKMQRHDIESHKQFRAKGTVAPSVSEVKQYPWGTVLFTVGGRSAVVEDLWLFLSDEDPLLFRQAVDEIEKFEKQK